MKDSLVEITRKDGLRIAVPAREIKMIEEREPTERFPQRTIIWLEPPRDDHEVSSIWAMEDYDRVTCAYVVALEGD